MKGYYWDLPTSVDLDSNFVLCVALLGKILITQCTLAVLGTFTEYPFLIEEPWLWKSKGLVYFDIFSLRYASAFASVSSLPISNHPMESIV